MFALNKNRAIRVTAFLSPERCRQFLFAYHTLYRLTDEDAEITCGSVPLSPDSVFIRVEADDLVFRDAPSISAAIQTADAVDFYPLTNGRIRMELTFHRMLLHCDAT